jgi:hypothetical protein
LDTVSINCIDWALPLFRDPSYLMYFYVGIELDLSQKGTYKNCTFLRIIIVENISTYE